MNVEAVDWWGEGDPFEDLGDRVEARVLEGMVPALVEYQMDPIGFAVDVLGIPEWTIRWSLLPCYEGHVWDGTPDPLATAVEALAAGSDVGVESCTGSGKSYTLGWLMAWFVSSWEGARVFPWATKLEQLEIYAFAELRRHFPRFRRRFPRAQLYTSTQRLRLYMDPAERRGDDSDDAWGIFGRSAAVRAEEDVATRASGMHAPHMLIPMEEMQGIDPAITKAIKATCTGQHNPRFGIGNPDNQHDALHRFCMEKSVRHIRISALDTPNVVHNVARDPEWLDVENDEELIPGMASRKFVLSILDEPGGEEGRLYTTRVRGISPEQAADALIRAEWVRAAFARYEDFEERERLRQHGMGAMGVDVARSEAGDKAAIAEGEGAVLERLEAFHNDDTAKLALKVGARIRLAGIPELYVGVDTVGIGSGTADTLKLLGIRARDLNGGAAAIREIDKDADREELEVYLKAALFLNLRAQMWWQLARDLERGRLAIRPDEELLRDLTIPTWFTRNGKIVVEPKEEIIKRLGRSPNKGDAVVYWNFVRYRYRQEEDPGQLRAFDPEVLRQEALDNRRAREQVVVESIDPLTTLRI